jgi:hypothetical protein
MRMPRCLRRGIGHHDDEPVTALADAWPDYEDEVFERVAPHPREAVLFAQLSLKDVPLAWNLAHSLGLQDDRAWSDLAKAYEKLDPLAVLPRYCQDLWMSEFQAASSVVGGSSCFPHVRSVVFRLVAQQDGAAREGAVLQQSQRDP